MGKLPEQDLDHMLAELSENKSLTFDSLRKWFTEGNKRTGKNSSGALDTSQSAAVSYLRLSQQWGTEMTRYAGDMSDVVADLSSYEPADHIKKMALVMMYSGDPVLATLTSNQRLRSSDLNAFNARLEELSRDNKVSYDEIISPTDDNAGRGFVMLYVGNNLDQKKTTEIASSVQLPFEILNYSQPKEQQRSNEG